MFNKDFYPTPKSLISRLLTDIGDCYEILEPSAGSGSIVDYIHEECSGKGWYSRHTEIDCIELDPQLQATLRGKEYRVVHDDFLTFDTKKHYDLIVANFPFSEGEKHLDKAIRMLEKTGGKLRCLVNAETIKNQFSVLRQSLVRKLERYNASIEFIENAFSDAERSTDVEVALIKLDIIVENNFGSAILDKLEKSNIKSAVPEEEEYNELIQKDFIKAIVALFNKEVEIGINLIKELYSLDKYNRRSLGKSVNQDRIINLTVGDKSCGKFNEDVNRYLRLVRSKYWNGLFSSKEFTSQYTSNLLASVTSKIAELADYDFSEFNIRSIKLEMDAEINKGVEESIMKLFDTCTHEYSYYGDGPKKNIHMYNGWKTNKAHKINDKVIIPITLVEASWSDSRKTKYTYRACDTIEDMVKVFNYLAREDSSNTRQLVSSLIDSANNFGTANEEVLDFGYFTLRAYKKGTVHIKFKNLNLLEKFNIYGSQRKGWLPPSYGKAGYETMTDEEKAVIDDFQGKEVYEKVMQDPQTYLVESSGMLLLN